MPIYDFLFVCEQILANMCNIFQGM